MPRFAALLALTGALFVTACDDQPTSPPPGRRPNALISDANHGGQNKEVFFLPPIVSNPSGSPFFKAGEFNPNLTSAVIRVCHMVNGLCEEVVASFGAGQETGPITITSDHYLAVWHTDESSPALVVGDAYRIEVFPDADVTADPIAWADVVVASTGKELKSLNTNETIGLIDGRTLPIKVRFQNGVRCESDNCKTQRVTNAGGTVVLQTGNGALLFSAGWLPPGLSEVTVTLQRHATGSTNDCVGNAAFTGPGLVAQRESCLEVETDPAITPGPTTGIQRPVFVYLCTEADEEDPLHEFLQVIKADDDRPLQALKDVSHQDLLALGFDPSCEGTPPPPVGLESHPLMQLAARGLNAITRPVARLLEVKPLYAIDLGQGGEIDLFDGFSFFTLGVQAIAAPFGTTPETAPAGSTVGLSVQITSLNQHTPGEEESQPLAGIDVTFTITDGDGGLTDPDEDGESAPDASVTVLTNSDGVATVDLHVATGTNVVEAVASVDEGPLTQPVTFTIDGDPLIVTSTAITTSAPLAVVGVPVQLEATVSPAPARAGSVEFFDGATSLGTAALFPNGTASLTVSSFALRAHTLSATFLGNVTHATSSSAAITQHTVQRYTSLAAFQTAVGAAAVQVQNFDALAAGTPITSLIAGVLSVNSPFPVLHVRDCTGSPAMFGESSETFNPRTTPTEFGFNSFYDLLFQSASAPRNALAFEVVAQDPATQPAVLEITGITTPTARLFVSNTSGSESTPVFVGMIASEPLNRVIVNEGGEVNPASGNEEVCLDSFRVANVSLP